MPRLKASTGSDAAAALKAMKASALRDDRGLGYVQKLGYIPADAEAENVAKGLNMRSTIVPPPGSHSALGQQEDYAFFSTRAKNYRHYFDPQTRFMRGRVSETAWRTPFSPFVSRHHERRFCRRQCLRNTHGLYHHDVAGLMELLGGPKDFTDKLDSLFTAEGDARQ